jgi:GT2 family glycosyltransferase
MQKIVFVVASRQKREDFYTNTATGRSLSFYKFPFVEVNLYAENSSSLSYIYNQSIEKYIDQDVVLVFAHDDLHILDFFWVRHLFEGLAVYDVIGIVGNRKRSPMQPSWAFLDTQGTWDTTENFSGVVGHGQKFPGNSLAIFGINSEVQLLDGLFLSVKSETLKRTGVRFDARFKFHFYDMDLCRSAIQAGLRLGTVPISLIHESGGNFSSPTWIEGYGIYINKWGS